MINLKSPLIGLLFLQRNSTILYMRQGIPDFPLFSYQLKNGECTHPNVIEPKLNPVETTLQRGERTTIWVKLPTYTDNEATVFNSLLQFKMTTKIFAFAKRF